MKNKMCFYIDKSEWPDGPWKKEPDKIEFETKSKLPGIIIRSDFTGSLCGYVGIKKGHPLFGVEYTEIEHKIDVYGGLSYSGHRLKNNDDIWWFGFDCAHIDDYCPGFENRGIRDFYVFSERGETYKEIDFVIEEINNLAIILKNKESGKNEH